MSKHDVAERKRYRSAPVTAFERRWIETRYWFDNRTYDRHPNDSRRCRDYRCHKQLGFEHLRDFMAAPKGELMRAIAWHYSEAIAACKHNDSEERKAKRSDKRPNAAPYLPDYRCESCATEIDSRGLCSTCESEKQQRDEERRALHDVLAQLGKQARLGRDA